MRTLCIALCLALVCPSPALASRFQARGAGKAVAGVAIPVLPTAVAAPTTMPAIPAIAPAASTGLSAVKISELSLAQRQFALAAPEMPAPAAKNESAALFERFAAKPASAVEGRLGAGLPSGLSPAYSAPGPRKDGVRRSRGESPRKVRFKLWHKIVLGLVLALGLGAGAWFMISPRLDPVRPPDTVVVVRPGPFELQPDKQALSKFAPDPAQPKLERSLSGPREPIAAARVADDGLVAVTVTAGGSWRVWELGSGEALKPGRYNGPAVGAALSPDGRTVILLDRDSKVHLLDRQTNEVRSIAPNSGPVAKHSFSPDGRRLAFSTTGGKIVVLDLDTAKAEAFQPQGELVALAATNQETLVVTTMAGKVKLWQIKPGQSPVTLAEKNVLGASLLAADIGADGRRLVAAGGFAGKLGVIAVTVGSSKAKILSGDQLELNGASIAGISVDGTGDRVAIVASDGRLWVWDMAYDDLVAIGKMSGPGPVSFSRDGKTVYASDSAGNLHFWKSE